MTSWVKLRPRSGGQSFCFFNTHFDNIGSRARLESANLLRAKISAIAVGVPTIITGDFNTDEQTAPYKALVSAASAGVRFIDTFRAANPQQTKDIGTRHGFRGGRGGPRIDWILTTGSFQTLAAAIDYTRQGGRYPSDHFPVTAVLRVMPSATMAVIE
jgi:endonuclease/exonuclease/phosphatase family metal-dependent hydrolase